MDEPLLNEPPSSSKLLPWLIIILIALIIIGLAWFYLVKQESASNTTANQSAALSPTATAPADEFDQNQSDIDSSLVTLDKELDSIKDDNNSTDDQTPNL